MKKFVSVVVIAIWHVLMMHRNMMHKKGHMTKCDGCYSRIKSGQKTDLC